MIAQDLATALDPSRVMLAAGLTPDPWQAELLRSQSKQHLLLCTRQAGKSTTTAALAVWTAIYQAPALILLLSPSLRQSQELFRKVCDFDDALGNPVKPLEKSALRVEYENGSRIIALPGSEETVRGYSGVKLLIVDEASRVEDALYFSIRPMLAVSNGRLVMLSTPFGKRGAFFEAWQGAGQWERHKVTAYDCPRIDPNFLEEERASMGQWWFEQEYLCEFKDTTDQIFTSESVDAALSNRIQPLQLANW
jgi:hypothetical protein